MTDQIVKASRRLERELILKELEDLAAQWERSTEHQMEKWPAIQLRAKIKQLRLQRIR